MGLLDGILGNLAEAALGGAKDAPAPQAGLGALLGGLGLDSGSPLAGAALALFEQHGGLNGVLELLRSHGLGPQVDSWIGGGPNALVSPEQISAAFGSPALQALAARFGLPEGEIGALLARFLPDLVNQLTPEGRLPAASDDLLSQGLALLRGAGR